MRRRLPPPTRWALLASGLVLAAVVAGCATDSRTAARRDTAIGPTFSHLVVRQQELLGRQVPANASLTVLPACKRSGLSKDGPGDDWICVLTVVGPTLSMTPVTYEVRVRADGCFSAEGPPAFVGQQLLRDVHGRNVVNPLWQFDGCFDTT